MKNNKIRREVKKLEDKVKKSPKNRPKMQREKQYA